MKLVWSVALVVIFAAAGVWSLEEKLEWWKTAIFYQIYPRSFKDSDGDGIGDLAGITEKLDYLAELGITAVWLSPIFKSPMADFGYDISDFKDIDPLFGTLEDFDSLVKRSKELGLKVVLDLVPNHSSDEHEWFQKSVKKEDPYTNYYVWADPKYNETGGRVPPNNWISIFMGSAWEWNEERQQYYLHEFVKKQPDLNYRSPELVNEMKNMIRFWLDRGVDGFRIDAVPYLFEDQQLTDNPPSNDPNALPGEYGSLLPANTANLPETYDMVNQWRKLLEDYQKEKGGDPKVMLLEVLAEVDSVFDYYGTSAVPGGHLPFNFFFTLLNNESSAADFHDTVRLWMDRMKNGRWPNWVVGNHDQHRVGSRFSPELIDGINMYTLLLPGTAITYNGEEIGMLDTFISWNDTVDPAGINAGPDRYLQFTRDPERTPYQWDNTTSAGFSTNETNETTWLPVNENYLELNLRSEQEAERSHYKVYLDLVEARKSNTIQKGSLLVESLTEGILAFTRSLQGEDTYIVIINLMDNEEEINLKNTFQGLPEEIEVYTSSIYSSRMKGDMVTASKLAIAKKESLVLISTVS